MESFAEKKYIRMSRRKIARIARECVNKKLGYVKPRLAVLPQEASVQLWKTIRSAEANYQHKNPNANTDDLVVKSISVNVGPTIRRLLPRARGSADEIRKRSAHIQVVLTDGKV